MPVVGFLGGEEFASKSGHFCATHSLMGSEHGYIDRHNLHFVARWAVGTMRAVS